MYRVALRYKSKRGDTMKSVYLEFRPSITDIRGHVIRYEFLNLELYTKPKNAIQKQHNKVIEEVAEEIRCKRYLQLVRRDFSFISKDMPRSRASFFSVLMTFDRFITSG